MPEKLNLPKGPEDIEIFYQQLHEICDNIYSRLPEKERYSDCLRNELESFFKECGYICKKEVECSSVSSKRKADLVLIDEGSKNIIWFELTTQYHCADGLEKLMEIDLRETYKLIKTREEASWKGTFLNKLKESFFEFNHWGVWIGLCYYYKDKLQIRHLETKCPAKDGSYKFSYFINFFGKPPRVILRTIKIHGR